MVHWKSALSNWLFIFGVYLADTKTCGSPLNLPPAGEVAFAGWQTWGYFNIFPNNGQEEKAKRLARGDYSISGLVDCLIGGGVGGPGQAKRGVKNAQDAQFPL